MKSATFAKVKKLRKLGVYETNEELPQAFWDWFGDSKVVDASGNPLIVYHGSVNRGFDEFDPSAANVRASSGPKGVYFTSDQAGASNYTRLPRKLGDKSPKAPPGQMIAAYLKINNPLDITASIKKHMRKTKNFGQAKALALKELTPEHDGVIFRGDNYNHDEYIVFEPNQIKSATKNNGEFSPSSNNIFEDNANFSSENPIMKPSHASLKENAVTSYFKADYYQVEREGETYKVWVKEFSKYFEAVGIVMSLDGATGLKDIEENNRFGIQFSYPSDFPLQNPDNVKDASPHTPNVKVGVNETKKIKSEAHHEDYDSFEDWADALVAKHGEDVDYEHDPSDDKVTRALLGGKIIGVFASTDDSGFGAGKGTILAEASNTVVYPPGTGQNQSGQWMATSWLSGKEGQAVGTGKTKQDALNDLQSKLKEGFNPVDGTSTAPNPSPANFSHSGVDWFQKEGEETVHGLQQIAADHVRQEYPGAEIKFLGTKDGIDVVDAKSDRAYGTIDFDLGEFIPFEEGVIGYEVPNDNSLPDHGKSGEVFSLAQRDDIRGKIARTRKKVEGPLGAANKQPNGGKPSTVIENSELNHGDMVQSQLDGDYYFVDLENAVRSTAERPWIDSVVDVGTGFYSDAQDLVLVASAREEGKILSLVAYQVIKNDNPDDLDEEYALSFAEEQAETVYDHFGDYELANEYILDNTSEDFEEGIPGNSLENDD